MLVMLVNILVVSVSIPDVSPVKNRQFMQHIAAPLARIRAQESTSNERSERKVEHRSEAVEAEMIDVCG